MDIDWAKRFTHPLLFVRVKHTMVATCINSTCAITVYILLCWMSAGEIYLSFFNLNSDTAIISAKIKDLAKSVPANYLSKGSCKCYEVWGAEYCRIRDGTITKTLDGHGSALFLLICT